MFPYIDLHFIKIPLYGLNIVLGGLIAGFMVYFLCHRKEKNFMDFIIISTLMVALGFVFAKIFYLLVSYPLKEIPKVLLKMLTNPKSPEVSGGFVFYGGIFGALIGYFIGIKIAKCGIKDFAGIYTFALPFVHAFGRVGCLCAGCCYGIHYNGPFALRYRNPISSVETGVGIFPVQVLESLLLLIFAIVIFILILKDKKVSILYYTGYYSVVRFCLEYLRGDVERGGLGCFSTSQWVSIFLFAATVIVFVVIKIRKKSAVKIEK